MKRLLIIFLVTLFYLSGTQQAVAQSYPMIDPTATYTDTVGVETTLHMGESYSGSAPLKVRFEANPEDDAGWTSYYEWRFYKEEEPKEPYLIRYEQDTEYNFTVAGAHRIMLYATFTQGTDVIEYTEEYWQGEGQPITISVSESKLEMPNAFSPGNGDEFNNIYKPKSGYKSIVEFHATIYNRWGVKLFEWSDPSTGWDGTYKGRPVAQGVYFVQVHAKGADGRVFNIRRDVNLLRGFTESTSTVTE